VAYLSCGIDAALSAGDLETAAGWLSELSVNLNPSARCVLALHEGGRVWEALLRNDFTTAAAHLELLEKLGAETGWPQFAAVIEYLGVQVREGLGDEAGARSHLGRLEAIASSVRSPYLQYMSLLARAQLALDRGCAEEALRAALALGRSGGYWNHHGWRPEVMGRLCERALELGIEVAHVKELIRRRALTLDPSSAETETWPWPIQIISLGSFDVVREGKPIRFSHKVQRKPLALLKSLVAAGGRPVSEETLTDALWPDAEGDAARAALSSALHRLRGLLGCEEAIERKDGKLTLVARFCWVDVWAVERLLARAETAAAGADAAGVDRLARKAVALYRGPFLGDEAPQIPQGTALVERIRRRLLRQVVALGRDHEQSRRWPEAVDWYEEALRIDPCAEDVYRSLMSVYRNLGRPADVEETYRRCRENLAARLAIAPASETGALLETLVPKIRT
jgi:DNA-binding SARP family transcriptional activator